jgi:head-tail adaptor
MPRMIRAGKYNKVITLQKRDYDKERKSGYGSSRPFWKKFAEVRASVEPLQGREYFSGPFQMGENIVRVRMRALPGKCVLDTETVYLIFIR